MKLNYTSLQHAVEPGRGRARWSCRWSGPVAVLALHGQLAARRLGVRPGARPDGGSATCRPRAGRCRAGTRARSRRCASAGCSRGTSPPARPSAARARRSRPRARCTTASASSAGTPPSAGPARASSARARARPRRHGGARLRPRRARARLPDAARRADVLGRRPRAPPRHLPPHADGPRPAARAGHGRAARGHALARRRRPAGGARSGVRQGDAAAARRSRSTSSARRASPATTGAARGRPARLRGERAADARRWAADWPKTRCSSARRSPAAPRWPSWPQRGTAERARTARESDERRSAMSAERQRAPRVRGAGRRDASTRDGSWTCGSSASATPTAKRSTREIVRHHGAVGIVAYDEQQLWLVRQPREAVGSRTCWRSPRGAWTWRARSRCDAAKRELAEEIGRGARAGSRSSTTTSSAGFTDERVHLFAATDLLRGERRERARTSASRSCRWPLAELDAGDRRVPRREDADRPDWLARRLNA